VANCIARMAQIPKVIAAAQDKLRRPPRPILETAIRQTAARFFLRQRHPGPRRGDAANATP